ncbi:MAG TPA: hypothetical protein VFL28_07120 [bacterium]|nr:hypothetical protein [bacterium]
MSHLGSDFWHDFEGTRTDQDVALIQTMRTVRAIRGADRPRAGVPEEIRAALAHLCAAMEGLVDWMEQEGGTDSNAMQLLQDLHRVGDGVVRCLSACPVQIILEKADEDAG